MLSSEMRAEGTWLCRHPPPPEGAQSQPLFRLPQTGIHVRLLLSGASGEEQRKGQDKEL